MEVSKSTWKTEFDLSGIYILGFNKDKNELIVYKLSSPFDLSTQTHPPILHLKEVEGYYFSNISNNLYVIYTNELTSSFTLNNEERGYV